MKGALNHRTEHSEQHSLSDHLFRDLSSLLSLQTVRFSYLNTYLASLSPFDKRKQAATRARTTLSDQMLLATVRRGCSWKSRRNEGTSRETTWRGGCITERCGEHIQHSSETSATSNLMMTGMIHSCFRQSYAFLLSHTTLEMTSLQSAGHIMCGTTGLISCSIIKAFLCRLFIRFFTVSETDDALIGKWFYFIH